MATQLQLRRGNTAQTSVFTGVIAEVTVDTDKKTIVVHDGVTVGGFPLALEQVASGDASAALGKANSAFDQANLAFNKANSANILAQQAFDAANSAVTSGQANVGAGLISVRTDLTNNVNNLYANIGAARISDTAAGEANVGSAVISIRTDLTNNVNAIYANIGAARITDTSASQANVGAGLISVRSDYEANVGDLRIDTETANTNLKNYVDVANTNLKNYSDNTFFAKTGGTISGNVSVSGNIIPTTDNVYYLGSESQRWHSLYVGPGSINLGGIVLGNVSGTISIAGATDLVLPNADSPGLKSLANIANSAFDQANLAFDWANSAYDFANTRFSSSGGTISGDVNITGNLSISGNVTSINTTELNVSDNEIILNSNWQQGVTPTQNAGITVNRGGSNVFLRYDESNDYWVLRDNTDQYIIATTANVGAGDIAVTNSSQANVGAGLISVRTDLTNNVNNLYANIGAARISDSSTSQANVGAALIEAKSYTDTANTWHQGNTGQAVISITNAYQANVGAGLISVRTDLTNNVNNLYANIGAARIADTAASQANVGAGLISVTNAYQANVGDAKIIALGRADSAFAQANLAFDTANSKLSSSGGTISGDLSVTGNLTISGNTTTINVSSLKVTDTIIQLGYENNTDILDIGFIGHYANTPNNHTGLVRSYLDGKYYLFDNWQTNNEPTNLVDIANTRVATLSANLVTSVITLRGLDPLDYSNTINSTLQANIGAARIADTAAGQANVGAGLISVRTDLTNNVNNLYANIGSARITDVAAGQANVGAGLISVRTDLTNNVNALYANVGALRSDTEITFVKLSLPAGSVQIVNSDISISGNLTVTGTTTYLNTTELNVSDNDITLNSDWPTNLVPTQNAGITIQRGLHTNAYIRYDESNDYWVLRDNIAQYIIATTANVGAGDISVTNAYEANVGAGLISAKATSEANVGAGLLTKVAKAGDTITGVLTITGGDGTYSSLELNGYNQRGGAGYHGFLKANNTNATNGAKHFRINSAGGLEIVNSGYNALVFAISDTADLSSVKSIRLYESLVTSGTISTTTLSQVTLDSFATASYRSAKYLVQMTSGSSYHMIELSLIHDGTTVYLSQYGEVKTGSSLGTFDASIAGGTLSVLFTPTNASTVVKFSVNALAA